MLIFKFIYIIFFDTTGFDLQKLYLNKNLELLSYLQIPYLKG